MGGAALMCVNQVGNVLLGWPRSEYLTDPPFGDGDQQPQRARIV